MPPTSRPEPQPQPTVTDKPRRTLTLLLFALALAMAYMVGMHTERGRQKLARARLETPVAHLR